VPHEWLCGNPSSSSDVTLHIYFLQSTDKRTKQEKHKKLSELFRKYANTPVSLMFRCWNLEDVFSDRFVYKCYVFWCTFSKESFHVYVSGSSNTTLLLFNDLGVL
jgi:hypothetical protein